MSQLDLLSSLNDRSDLPELFKRNHYYLYTNSNISRPERLGAEMTRLLFCKIFDEQYSPNGGCFENVNRESQEVAARRIRALFEKVKEHFPEVFEQDERLHLNDNSLCYVASQLESQVLSKAKRDAIGEAFQSFWGPELRGEKGQFFTPRNVVELCVSVINPGPHERIIDPACGSGGFLVECLRYLGAGASIGNLFGIDKEVDLARICMAYLAIAGDPHPSVFCADSLNPGSWPEHMAGTIVDGQFDVILTNPPFGARIAVEDRGVLKRYELAYKWRKTGDGVWMRTRTLSKQAPQVLFIERCLQLLKPGGRMAIVLPDGIFGNPSDGYIVQYLQKHTRIIAVISLAPETFLPSTHTKTSVLVLQKNEPDAAPQKYGTFMAIATKIGHNKNGKLTYRMNQDGELVFNSRGERVIDDDLPLIAEQYHRFSRNELSGSSHLGFSVEVVDRSNPVLIPAYYDPEIQLALNRLKSTGRFRLVTIGELIASGCLSVKRGNEVGSQFYGMGDVPFVRTSDIVNWEIKADPVKSIPEHVYQRYRQTQDVRPDDILLVTDGTFLIGRSAIVTAVDKRLVIQSHIRRLRCPKPDELHPYVLLYLLNMDIVQRQIRAKTFVQATISTLGPRINEIVLPIPLDKTFLTRIVQEVRELIHLKVSAREKIHRIKQLNMEEE